MVGYPCSGPRSDTRVGLTVQPNREEGPLCNPVTPSAPPPAVRDSSPGRFRLPCRHRVRVRWCKGHQRTACRWCWFRAGADCAIKWRSDIQWRGSSNTTQDDPASDEPSSTTPENLPAEMHAHRARRRAQEGGPTAPPFPASPSVASTRPTIAIPAAPGRRHPVAGPCRMSSNPCCSSGCRRERRPARAAQSK